MKIKIINNEVVEIKERKGKIEKRNHTKDERRYDRLKEERSGRRARHEQNIRQEYLTDVCLDSCSYIWNGRYLQCR